MDLSREKQGVVSGLLQTTKETERSIAASFTETGVPDTLGERIGVAGGELNDCSGQFDSSSIKWRAAVAATPRTGVKGYAVEGPVGLSDVREITLEIMEA